MKLLAMPESAIAGEIQEGQAVYIVWFDSASIHGWIHEDIPTSPKVIESIGFVAAVNEEAVVISPGRSNTGGFISPIVIPSCCIQKYSILEI